MHWVAISSDFAVILCFNSIRACYCGKAVLSDRFEGNLYKLLPSSLISQSGACVSPDDDVPVYDINICLKLYIQRKVLHYLLI